MPPRDRPPLTVPDAPPLPVPDGFMARVSALGVTLADDCPASFGVFLGRLLAMNELCNLTAITNSEQVWEKHVLDSLTLVPLLDEEPCNRLMDVGSGGGLPGIVLALARPALRVTLVEATQKKAGFLRSMTGLLGLGHVSVEALRAEQLVRSPHRGSYDVVTARAVGRIMVLAPLALPFVRPGGRLLLVKGQRAGEEIAEAAPVLRSLRATHERTVDTPTGKIVVLRTSPARGS